MLTKFSLLLLQALCVLSEVSWDIAVITKHQLDFYLTGRHVYSESAFSGRPQFTVLAYDAVYNNLLFADSEYIIKYDITTKTLSTAARISPKRIGGIAFNPVTKIFFWTDIVDRSIKLNKMGIQVNLNGPRDDLNDITLTPFEDDKPTAIAVDSCRRHIYWTNTDIMRPTIEKARFDGTERKVIVNANISMPVSLAIDQNTKTIYWVDDKENTDYSIESAGLNGENRRTLLFKDGQRPYSLTISKDSIYWVDLYEKTIWMLPKDLNAKPKRYMNLGLDEWFGIAANYPIGEQINENDCKALLTVTQNKSRPSNISLNDPIDVEWFCVHGKVIAESVCECTPGYTGEYCDISVCHNFCVQGHCNLTTEGQATCICKKGFIGERCEVDICRGFCLNDGKCSDEYNSPTCVCIGNYTGSRCETLKIVTTTTEAPSAEPSNGTTVLVFEHGDYTSTQRPEVDGCYNYCLNEGKCNLDQDQKKPICHCSNNFNGSRCETYIDQGPDTDACYNYCLHDGECKLDLDQKKPICHCLNNYNGSRCETHNGQGPDIDICYNYCLHEGKCILEQDQKKPVCHCSNNYNGSRCETHIDQGPDTDACYNYCLHEGQCKLGLDQKKPICHCLNNYNGSRCETHNGQGPDIDICYNYCLHEGECKLEQDQKKPVCHCINNYTGSRCETHNGQLISLQEPDTDACYNYCLHEGKCILEQDQKKPVCHCINNYNGSRCETHNGQLISLQEPDTDACYNYCLHEGECILDRDQKKPICHCLNNYNGSRCEIPIAEITSTISNRGILDDRAKNVIVVLAVFLVVFGLSCAGLFTVMFLKKRSIYNHQQL